MARVEVIMPQMGESIVEGTLSRWMKEVGDEVKRDEPIFEISTDMVDAEIPAPPRLLVMLGLTYDHRVVDGADADRFMADLKKQLQEFPFELVRSLVEYPLEGDNA